jgi:hypothetical protein
MSRHVCGARSWPCRNKPSEGRLWTAATSIAAWIVDRTETFLVCGITTFVSGELTVKEFIGIVTVDECLRDVEDFHQDDRITRNLVLYASGGSLGHLTSDCLRRIARSVRMYAHVRAGGKTAFVAPTDLEYAICRVLVVYIESTSFTPNIRVFRTLSEAAKWIGVDQLPFLNDD